MGEFAIPEIMISGMLLLVRVVLGVAFAREAKMKFDDIKGFARKDGVPIWAAWTVALAETAAAVSFLTGVLVQWAGLGVMLLMIITTAMHIFRWHSPYQAGKGGWEYDLLLFVLASVLLVMGAGVAALPM